MRVVDLITDSLYNRYKKTGNIHFDKADVTAWLDKEGFSPTTARGVMYTMLNEGLAFNVNKAKPGRGGHPATFMLTAVKEDEEKRLAVTQTAARTAIEMVKEAVSQDKPVTVLVVKDDTAESGFKVMELSANGLETAQFVEKVDGEDVTFTRVEEDDFDHTALGNAETVANEISQYIMGVFAVPEVPTATKHRIDNATIEKTNRLKNLKTYISALRHIKDPKELFTTAAIISELTAQFASDHDAQIDSLIKNVNDLNDGLALNLDAVFERLMAYLKILARNEDDLFNKVIEIQNFLDASLMNKIKEIQKYHDDLLIKHNGLADKHNKLNALMKTLLEAVQKDTEARYATKADVEDAKLLGYRLGFDDGFNKAKEFEDVPE